MMRSALIVSSPASLVLANSVGAYVGPGSGIGPIGPVPALLGGVLVLVVVFAWYPLKRLLRKRKSAVVEASAEEPEAPANRTRRAMGLVLGIPGDRQ